MQRYYLAAASANNAGRKFVGNTLKRLKAPSVQSRMRYNVREVKINPFIFAGLPESS